MKSRIIFLGTPRFAAKILNALHLAGFEVIGVITQPDKKSGRGGKVFPSETKLLAEKLSFPVYQPLNGEELDQVVRKLDPDLAVVAAYGKIIPKEVLDIPKNGFLNVHGSLLPRFRGGSCVPEAILRGDRETGVSIMKVIYEMDAGPILSQVKVPISDNDTTESLTEKLADAGAKEIVRIIPLWLGSKIEPKHQCLDEMVMCKLIKKEDAHIDWQESSELILRKIRAYYPWPVAYTEYSREIMRILDAGPSQQNLLPGKILVSGDKLIIGTGVDSIEINKLQLAGKKVISAKEFINGYGNKLNGNIVLK